MVDFSKRKASRSSERAVVPLDIYSGLDRASDKGPLRPIQVEVLDRWYREFRERKDVIVKLHTGQGKTLIGLLILQSKLNEIHGRALYLCPNKFLANQTLIQARQFGIKCVPVDPDGSLPSAFLDGEAILVSTVQKLFNGRTKFGLLTRSISVDYIVIDDAHACIDSIKAACQVHIPRVSPIYQKLLDLFAVDLKEQGAGSFEQIRLDSSGNSGGPVLPVPYWAWHERQAEVLSILARSSEEGPLTFVWPLVRDRLEHCHCVISASEIAIAPNLPPLEDFGSFERAKHRVFMTATVSDDSFLIKGLGLAELTVNLPLSADNEKWSGEKMILIPSVIAEDLDQGFITSEFGRSRSGKTYGTVVLTPSFAASEGWKKAGAIIAAKNDIDARVEALRSGDRDKTLAIANRYDGIDLPDDSCRVLIIDGKPFSESILDRHLEDCRPSSEVTVAKVARSVEQGLGRAVRGERDYCVVLITGADLVRILRARESKPFFSAQTRAQVELGLEISELAREDVAREATSSGALNQLMRQCLGRNEDWKAFYVEKMEEIEADRQRPKLLEIFSAELQAELAYQAGQPTRAVEILQALVNKERFDVLEKGWYLQEMARYQFVAQKAVSTKLQFEAHQKNRLLLKPVTAKPEKLVAVDQGRSSLINKFLRNQSDFESLINSVSEVTGNLRFGVRADTFERAWDVLGRMIGFGTERPDKEWKEGPDNLWVLRPTEYLLVECKNEVELTRASINKHESGQMNNSLAWFERTYPGCSCTNLMIIPTESVSEAAGFSAVVRIMRPGELGRLVARVKSFFREFETYDLLTVSEEKIDELVRLHKLDLASVVEEYSVPAKQR